MSTTVTGKDQVTMPMPVHDLLGITSIIAVDFSQVTEGQVVLTRADRMRRPASRVARLRGAVQPARVEH